MNRAKAVEIITGALAQQQLLDIRQAVTGHRGIQCERPCLLARLPYEDGQCCLKLRAADDIGQERSKRGEAVDSRGGYEFVDSGKVKCAFPCKASRKSTGTFSWQTTVASCLVVNQLHVRTNF